MNVALSDSYADYDTINIIIAAKFGVKPKDLQMHGRRVGHYGALSPSAATRMRKRIRQDAANNLRKLMTILTKLEKKIEKEMR